MSYQFGRLKLLLLPADVEGVANESILIVEDNQMNVQLVRALLSEEGYDLRSAGSAEEAISVLSTFKPGLILMDIQLPGQGGLDLTRQLRANPEMKSTTIVALTGYARKGDEENCVEAGCNGYIVKPIDVSTFPKIVRSYVEKSNRGTPEVQGDIRDLLRDMRNNFLVEVRTELTRFLSEAQQPDENRLVRALHRWGGIAGTLGMARVTEVSRRLEAFVESSHQVDAPVVREGLEELQRLIGAAAATQVADLPLPEDVVKALAGKRVALAGFAQGEAKRVAKAFDRAQSFTLSTEAPADGLANSSVQRFDVVVLNLCSTAGMVCYKNTAEQLDKPILLVASRSEVSEDVLQTENPLRDFLIAPWDAEELLLRCCKLLKDPAPAAPSAKKRTGPPQIVIADDDPTITALLTATLRRTSANCHIARSGVEALALVQEVLPDVLILDVNMPGMDGFEVLTNLRGGDKTARIPVVLLTARQQEADVLKGFSFGASDYIPKPFNPMELAARVARYLPRKDS
jgi:DNA-binding response OmpR family regulator